MEKMIDYSIQTKYMIGGDENACAICREDFTGNDRRKD